MTRKMKKSPQEILRGIGTYLSEGEKVSKFIIFVIIYRTWQLTNIIVIINIFPTVLNMTSQLRSFRLHTVISRARITREL